MKIRDPHIRLNINFPYKKKFKRLLLQHFVKTYKHT